MSTKHMFRVISAASFAALLACSAVAIAADDDSTSHSDTAGAAITDTAITAKVKAKYMNDTRLKHSDISVRTANGVVTLTGSAPGATAKSAATDLARNVKGVKSVDNDIEVAAVEAPSTGEKIEAKTKSATRKTERVASDSWITTKVKSALLADSVTKGFEISVKTRHHVVALSGTVDTQASADHAADLARQIKHVKSVDTSALKTGRV